MAKKKAAKAAGPWWGDGEPPTERWPGVTVPIGDEGGKYRFDAEKADRVCDFFPKYCSHSKGEYAGKAFALLDYQRDLILRPLFGWVDAKTGDRRFRKAYIEIPKKNGKTQLIAGLALYMLLGDSEPGAEVYVAAADREQARILFRAASAMVESNPALTKRLQVFRNQIVRKDDPTAFFQVLSAEAATKHGPNIHCLIMDELHAQPDRELFETLTRGVIARRQPLILLITTAGDDDESICYEEYEYAKRVLSGSIQDEQHLPVIFESVPEDDWSDPELWARVNPGMGSTISKAAVEVFAREAQNEPRKRNDFLRFHLNRWVNQAEAWIPSEWWDACDEPVASDAELRLLPWAAGLDMSQKIDLTAFVLAFRHLLPGSAPAVEIVSEDGGTMVQKSLNYRITVVPFFWIPEETAAEREREDRVPYRLWAEQGLITLTEGHTIDYDRVFEDITQKILPRFGKVKGSAIGYDPAFASDIAQRLERSGCVLSEVLQNYKYLNEPSHVLEGLIKAQRVSHGGHRVMRNHIENVAVKRDDAGRIKPVKPKTSRKRIDGVAALVTALDVLALIPDERKRAPRALVINPYAQQPQAGATV